MTVQHLARMFRRQAENCGAKTAFFHKLESRWQAISWRAALEEVQAVSRALLEFGVSAQEAVAIYAPNRPEWNLTDHAIQSVRAVTVPIYATSVAVQAEYIVADAGAGVLFLDGQFQYDNAMEFYGSRPHPTKIVVFDESTKIEPTADVMYYRDLLQIGRASALDDAVRQRLDGADDDDLCTIIYTSGTTGPPKGVPLTHRNMCSQLAMLDQKYRLTADDVELCFLPLSHVYGKLSSYWVQSHGATIYYCTDPKKIVDYFQEARPTYMVGVPRLYEKMYAAIHERLQSASAAKRRIFHWAVTLGKRYQHQRLNGAGTSWLLRVQNRIAQALVFKKIKTLLGGRLNFFSAGGAPLAKEIEEFFFAAGIMIYQGYGLTETSAVISCNGPSGFKFGTVGRVVDGCDLRIADDGEILVKGVGVTKGYHNRPDANKEAFTEDGWFKTGDIGRLDEEGFLRITDRKKDIIVTAGGKNVAPQNIESTIGKDFYIEQMVVVGDKRKYLSALVVPSFAALEVYAHTQGIEYSARDDLINKPEIIEFFRQRIEMNSDALAEFERIVKFKLVAAEFSEAGGDMTPTFKIKRKVVQEQHKALIDSMYND